MWHHFGIAFQQNEGRRVGLWVLSVTQTPHPSKAVSSEYTSAQTFAHGLACGLCFLKDWKQIVP